MVNLRENDAEATKAQAAGTAIKLKHELPIIEPVPISSSVTKTPIKLANNSGTEAPRAISVDPAMSGGKSYAARWFYYYYQLLVYQKIVISILLVVTSFLFLDHL